MSRKIVVTGGSGFIGSYVTLELAKDPDAEIVIMDLFVPDYDWPMPENVTYQHGDICCYDEVDRVVAGATEVYNIAGALGTSELLEQSAKATDVNVRGTVNVLEACRRRGVERVFYPTKPNDWLNTYSITKFAGEQFSLMYQQQYGMSVAVLRWFNAYGNRQHPYPVRKMIPTFCLQAIYDQPLTVYGDGAQTVDMIHVEDMAALCVRATRECGRMPVVMDVGSGEVITVKDVAESVIKIAGSRSEIVYLPMRAGEPLKSDIRAEVSPLEDAMGDLGLRAFRDGLPETVDYYRRLPERIVRSAFRYWGERFAETGKIAGRQLPSNSMQDG